MRRPAASGQPPALGGAGLVVVMLGLAGLGVVLGLFGFGMQVLDGVPLEVTLLASLLPPLLGYALGRWLGGRGRSQ